MGKIKIEGLTKHYVNRRHKRRDPGDENGYGKIINVFKDIDLEFEDGEMVCILGPSGCGKSTMLRIIAGFDSATSGTVVIDGETVVGPSPDHVFVFQQNGLLPWMTVWQNVELGLRNIKNEALRNETIQEYIDMVELSGFEHYFPSQLSGGMQRRAELGRALAVNPDILYMDEPFTGLDYLTHLKIREEVINMHTFLGKTMVMVTHFIDDALIMADRIIVFNESPAKVILHKKLEYSRPRNIEKDPGLSDLRDEVFMMLGVSYVA
ncbi:MAG: ABC transporter ATP-binding protein [Gammaproteobacteria bacterium]|nr:ABC transporter ATP-binding protein [Gammaproteobacteria bacterium]